MIGMGRRRYEATPEEIEAAKARDVALAARAEEALLDPNIGARIAGLLVSPRLLSYSVRNQALLLVQAEDREMGTLTDLKPFNVWRKLGRKVCAGEKSLRLVEFRGGKGDDDAGEASGDEDGEGRRAFRWVSKWDISQTEPIEGFKGEPYEGPDAPEVEPAAAMFESLKEQAERLGYTVTVWEDEPHTEPVGIDREAQTISVYDSASDAETLGRLAGVVAELTANRPKKPRAVGSTSGGDRAGKERPAKERELVITVQ